MLSNSGARVLWAALIGASTLAHKSASVACGDERHLFGAPIDQFSQRPHRLGQAVRLPAKPSGGMVKYGASVSTKVAHRHQRTASVAHAPWKLTVPTGAEQPPGVHTSQAIAASGTRSSARSDGVRRALGLQHVQHVAVGLTIVDHQRFTGPLGQIDMPGKPPRWTCGSAHTRPGDPASTCRFRSHRRPGQPNASSSARQRVGERIGAGRATPSA